ncbi:MAG: hypothetical protein HGB08_03530 [Candidatus Moranbacteria bacterium]|nr:hypothetical protein [Candidatus Moranbacteria bacterium]
MFFIKKIRMLPGESGDERRRRVMSDLSMFSEEEQEILRSAGNFWIFTKVALVVAFGNFVFWAVVLAQHPTTPLMTLIAISGVLFGFFIWMNLRITYCRKSIFQGAQLLRERERMRTGGGSKIAQKTIGIWNMSAILVILGMSWGVDAFIISAYTSLSMTAAIGIRIAITLVKISLYEICKKVRHTPKISTTPTEVRRRIMKEVAIFVITRGAVLSYLLW